MKAIFKWVGAAALVVVAAGAGAQPFQAGKDYIELDKPQRTVAQDAVEVREFFSYACPHCYTFVGPMHRWLEQAPEEIRYVRTPVVFNESWRTLAQAFHTADVLGVVEQTHVPMFTALHEENRRFRKAEDLAAFYAEQGVDKEKFMNTFKSFAVDTRMRKSDQIMRSYRVNSTPTVAVNGKYVVTPRTAGNLERMTEVIDHLVEMEAAKLR